MIRLYIVVEGQTEEQFAKRLLGPHLLEHGVVAIPFIVGTSRDLDGTKHRGGGHWKHWLNDLKKLSLQKASDVRFTTMFDLFRLPDDFPGVAEFGDDKDTVRRADKLTSAMAASVNDYRLIPYLQRHEFETLVLASLEQLATIVDDVDREGVELLRVQLKPFSPEDVNDGPATAPSKRLRDAIASYRKDYHGPLAVAAAGLTALRQACPRLHAWVAVLEALS